MFTGLVEAVGVVRGIETVGPGKDLIISQPKLTAELQIGDSVAINGACLTVVARDSETFRFNAGPETLLLTNLSELRTCDRVNLERALRLGDRLGGHLVQGHVDGVGRIRQRQREGDWELVWFDCPPPLAEQMVAKGSVAVDGVSLTVVDAANDRFSVALIPHTLAQTTLGFKPAGASVNLETDLFAKYVWKCLRSASSPRAAAGTERESTDGVTWETLRQAGFVR